MYFPAIDATKSDLVSYYLGIGRAPPQHRRRPSRPVAALPGRRRRQVVLQKRIPAGAPDWLQSTIVSTPNGTTSDALVVADISHVVWAVNFGCLGLHLWPYLAADPEHADELRIDLDPTKGIGFDEVRAAALKVKELLDELGLVGSPRRRAATGSTCTCASSPVGTRSRVRAAAVALARELERRAPDEITAKWWKEESGGHVFVDFNQNAPHKTVFGAWFARPRVGGQVSTPLAWDEVETVVPDELTIHTVPELVGHQGDPWADFTARAAVDRTAPRHGRAGQGGRAPRRAVAPSVPQDARRAPTGGAEPGQEGNGMTENRRS